MQTPPSLVVSLYFPSLTSSDVWQVCCLFKLRRSTHRNFSWRQKRGEIAKLAARRNRRCLIARAPFSRVRGLVSESQKRSKYEIAKSRVHFCRHDVFVFRQVVSTAGEDRV